MARPWSRQTTALEERGVVRRELIDPDHPELGTRDVPLAEKWIWKGRIRPGDLVVVVGGQGSGKTTMLCDWMARITTGEPFPGDPPELRREPGEVLLFNGCDSFTETIQPRIVLSQGDLGRVSLVTKDLQSWSGVPSEIPEGWQSFHHSPDNARDCRCDLHLRKTQEWLRRFLKNRPKVQMVVIDNVWSHMRADSERKFCPIVNELMHIARETEVTVVLSLVPNAYRADLGAAEFLKSESLLAAARSIWHTVRPKDLTAQSRIVQCLKVNQEPLLPGSEDPWGLFLREDRRLVWLANAAPQHSRSKKSQEARAIGNTLHFLKDHLEHVGGVAEYNTLRLAAKKLGISTHCFLQAILLPDFDCEYEPLNEDELMRVIGLPEAMARRRADPNPPPLKISNPPGGAKSTDDPPDEMAELIKSLRMIEAPGDPPILHRADFPNQFPGDRLPASPAADAPAAEPARSGPPRETVNLRREFHAEKVGRLTDQAVDEFLQQHLGTPPGWNPPTAGPLFEIFQAALSRVLAERGVEPPLALPPGFVPAFVAGVPGTLAGPRNVPAGGGRGTLPVSPSSPAQSARPTAPPPPPSSAPLSSTPRGACPPATTPGSTSKETSPRSPRHDSPRQTAPPAESPSGPAPWPRPTRSREPTPAPQSPGQHRGDPLPSSSPEGCGVPPTG